MIRKLLEFLELDQEQIPEKETLTVPLATAVLFYEVIRADHVINPKEMEAYRNLVRVEFDLTADAAESLMEKVKEKVEEAVDYMQFTRLLHENCTLEEKCKIIGMLWHLAASDGHIDPHEEHLIRKFADLMYLTHAEFIQAKLGTFPH